MKWLENHRTRAPNSHHLQTPAVPPPYPRSGGRKESLPRPSTAEVCQLSNTLLIVRIYHDQALDAIHIQPAQLQHGKILVMQGDEITDVAVHRPRKDNARLWVEPMCCHSTSKRVKVRILMGRDQRFRLGVARLSVHHAASIRHSYNVHASGGDTSGIVSLCSRS